MYRIEEKRKAILEIQEFLSVIYEEEDLYKSGVYDSKTDEQVMRFQEEKKLPVTGKVDFATHKEIYNSYEKLRQNEGLRNFSRLNIDFPISEGLYHEDMVKINKELSELLTRYGVYHSLRARPHYSRATADAVREIRKIMMLPDRDIIDEELYYRMTRDLGAKI